MSREKTNSGQMDFGVLLNVAFGAFKDALHLHLANAGFDDLGGSFGYVLRTLNVHPEGMSLKDLAQALGVTSPGTQKIVDDMEAKGYVERSLDPQDTRIRRLTVATRGKALLEEARRFHARFEARLGHKLGKEAVEQTRAVLEALAKPQRIAPSIRMQIL